MTPPPSDADKPGTGGRKPDPVPSKPGQPGSAGSPAKSAPSPIPAAGGAKPGAPEVVKPPQGTGAGLPPNPPPKPATEPVVAAKPGAAEVKSGAAEIKPGVAEIKPGAAEIKPGLPDAKSEAGRPGPGVAAAEGSRPPAGPATPTGATVPPLKTEPFKAPGPSPASAPEAGKTAFGAGAAKVEPPKAAQTGPSPQSGTGPQSGTSSQAGTRPGGSAAADAVTAGPIIDLKAKRIPDAPPPGGQPAKDGIQDNAKAPPKDTGPGAGMGTGTGTGTANLPKVLPAPAGRARAGFGALATAGLLGGVIGAGLLFGAEKAGIGTDPRLNALDQKVSGQISSLDKRVDGLAPRDAVATLDKQVASAQADAKQALDKAANALAQGGGAAEGSAASPAAGQGLTGGQAAGQASGAVPADLVARLDSLDQRVAALQEEPGRDQPADAKLGVVHDNAKPLADLEARLKAVEENGSGKGAAEEASKRVAALQGEVEQRTKANADADAALGQRLDTLQQTLEGRVKSATEAVQAATQAARTAAEAGQTQAAEAAKAVDRRLQEQAEKIAALDRSVAQRAEVSTVQAALRVVVADRVASALAAGMPYAEPLATLRKLDPATEAQAAALAPFADTGAPTAGQLADAFRPIAERIATKRQAQRAKSAAETGDFRSKLLSMADGLVQVRKVDAPAPEASDDPEGKVQAALDRGDLSAASAAFAALPAEARDQAGDFGAKLTARADADAAVRTLLAGAFKALPTGAASTPAPEASPAPAPGR